MDNSSLMSALSLPDLLNALEATVAHLLKGEPIYTITDNNYILVGEMRLYLFLFNLSYQLLCITTIIKGWLGRKKEKECVEDELDEEKKDREADEAYVDEKFQKLFNSNKKD